MIRYKFAFEDGTSWSFEVDEEGETAAEDPEGELPEWIELRHFTCPRCALPPGSRRTCPAALSIKPIVDTLATRVSFEEVVLTVEREGHTLTSHTSLQQAARSLIGLVLPLSPCPVIKKLRPMARMHRPLGERVHTAFRFMGMYMVVQRIRWKAGHEPDWELRGLIRLMDDIHMVNHALAARIRYSEHLDATINALVGLDFFRQQRGVEHRGQPRGARTPLVHPA